MHIGNREEAKMKLVLSQSEILTDSTVREKKREMSIISRFASAPTSVFLWRADDLTEGKLQMAWGVWVGRDQEAETESSEGFHFWIPTRRTGIPAMAWELPGWTIHTFYDNFCPRQKTQHVWKTHFVSFVF